MTPQKRTVELFSETLPLSYVEQGEGRPFLLLHSGAGPGSMIGLAGVLATNGRAILPTYPGFNGEPRPERFARIDDLALAGLAIIEKLDLRDVVVIGNSVGGWIAAEMALRNSPRIASIVLINAAGIETGSAELAIADPMAVPPAERARMAFHNPQKFAVAPATPEAAAVMAENQKTLRVYAGNPFMHDPTLRARLRQVSVPAMVIWGASDKVVDAEYGRVFADSIPNGLFELVTEAGHFPQIERLEEVVRLIRDFTGN